MYNKHVYPRNRFGLDKNWKTTIFILNLAVPDFLYSFFSLPLYATQYIYGGWPWSHEACYTYTVGRIIVAFADWMFLGIIALSRCLVVTQPSMWEEICKTNLRVFGIIAASWLYAVVIIIPIFFDVSL